MTGGERERKKKFYNNWSKKEDLQEEERDLREREV